MLSKVVRSSFATIKICYNKDGQPTRVEFLLVNRPALSAPPSVEMLEGKGAHGDPDLAVHRPLKFTFPYSSAGQEIPVWRRPKCIPLEIEGRTEEEDADLAADIEVQTADEHQAAFHERNTGHVLANICAAGDEFLLGRVKGLLKGLRRHYTGRDQEPAVEWKP